MTQPTIIQTPGALQFAQQGLEQGLAMGERREQIGLERQKTEAGIAATQQELALKERQVAAEEGFRRGYADYLHARGEYYGQKAKEGADRQAVTQQWLQDLSTKDPQTAERVRTALAIGGLDPKAQAPVYKAIFGDDVQKGHQAVAAANLFVHSGGSLTLGQSYEFFGGDPKTLDPKLAGTRAPQKVSALNAQSRQRLQVLYRQIGALRNSVNDADRKIQQYGTTVTSNALMTGQTQPQQDSTVQAFTRKNFPQLESQRAKLTELIGEATGLTAPQLGPQGDGTNAPPVIPDNFGTGQEQQPQATPGIDYERLNDLIDNMQSPPQ